MGLGRREGRVTIVSPGVIKVSANQLVNHQDSKVTLAGGWSGFPPGAVSKMRVVAFTREDTSLSLNPFNIAVNGAAQGRFSGGLSIEPYCVSPKIRFDLNLSDGGVYRTGLYSIVTRLEGDSPRL